uniref:Putative rna-directed dna polymerase from mobile element jockey n=1 Tax=Lutzomyia longipalpis TaxID=7200 RepID=A0A7G3B021_LUTLO
MDDQNSRSRDQPSSNNSNLPPALPPCSFIQWNCHGFWPRKAELDVLISTKRPIGICLQETHLNIKANNFRKIANINGYTAFHSNKSDNPTMSGGVSIFIQSGWKYEPVSLKTDLEVIAVKLHWHYLITIVSIYLKPGIPIHENKIKNVIRQIPSPYIILGDFNASNAIWGSNKTDPRGLLIEKILLDENCVLLNDGSHTNLSMAHGTFNAIDLSLISPQISSNFIWEVADDLYGSDHFPIFITDIDNYENLYTGCKKWIESSADWDKYCNLINANLPDLSLTNDNIYKDFLSVIINAAYQSIPFSKPSTASGRRRVPWWNNEIKNLINDRKKALRLFKKHPTTENKNRYLALFSEVKEKIEAAKRESWRLFTESIDLHTSSKEMWNKIKAIQGSRSPPIRRVDNKWGVSTDPKGMSDLLVKQFCLSSSNEILTESEKVFKNNITSSINNIALDPIPDSPLNLEFSVQELMRALNKSSGKSCGPNSITYNMLKNLPRNGIEFLLNIYNQMWCEDNFPCEWLTANIIPIPKPSVNGISDFRPIALSNCDLKIFERMVNYRLIWFLEENGLLNHNQFGFRSNRSTTQAIAKLTGDVLEAFEQTSHATAIFLDLEKAYDRVWDAVIIKQLLEWGIDGHILSFLKFYLNERTVRVRIKDVLSSEGHMINGVPQGGVLSVTLFLVAINSIFNIFDPDDPVKILLYADDVVIYSGSANIDDQYYEMQYKLNKMGEWANKNGFRFSPKKTKVMHFCRKQNCHRYTYSINGCQLECVTKFKFLGVWLDPKLRFNHHIQEVKTACSSRLNVLKCISSKSWGSNRDTMIKIHEATILSKIYYGSEIYATAAPKALLNPLNSIYNAGYRLSVGAFRTSPVNSILCEAGVQPLRQKLDLIVAKSASRILGNPEVPGYDDILNYENKKSSRSFYTIGGCLLRKILGDIHIDHNYIESHPPWILDHNAINTSIIQHNYKEMSNDEVVDLFNFVCNRIHPNHMILYTDGSGQLNNKGYAITSESDLISSHKCHESLSVFDLEASAIEKAFQFSRDLISIDPNTVHIIVASDSLSTITAVQNLNNSSPIIKKIRDLINELNNKVTLLWVPGHRDIPGNTKADIEAKTAAFLPNITQKLIFQNNAISLCKKYFSNIKGKWFEQEVPDNLKLVSSSPKRPVIPKNIPRKEFCIISRLRIGHTRLTQSYKFINPKKVPLCPSCKKPLTTTHILIECHRLESQRKAIFGNKNIYKLLNFSECDTRLVIKFISELDLIDEI